MDILKTTIEGLLVIEPKVFNDERGYFYESFNSKEFFNKTKIYFNPSQDNESKSKFGVIRGLHFQKPPYEQAKLVRVVKGEIMDVAVDLRLDSETFGSYIAVNLSEENKRQFFIPKGFAHGFVVLSDEAIFQYKCDEYYHPESESGLPYDFIDWEGITDGKIKKENFIVSDKDKNRERVKNLEELREIIKQNSNSNENRN